MRGKPTMLLLNDAWGTGWGQTCEESPSLTPNISRSGQGSNPGWGRAGATHSLCLCQGPRNQRRPAAPASSGRLSAHRASATASVFAVYFR